MNASECNAKALEGITERIKKIDADIAVVSAKSGFCKYVWNLSGEEKRQVIQYYRAKGFKVGEGYNSGNDGGVYPIGNYLYIDWEVIGDANLSGVQRFVKWLFGV